MMSSFTIQNIKLVSSSKNSNKSLIVRFHKNFVYVYTSFCEEYKVVLQNEKECSLKIKVIGLASM